MKNFIRIVFLLFIIVGFLLFSYDKVNSYKMIKANTEKVDKFFNNENKKKTISTDYIGIIDIPKIRLKKRIC